MKKCAKKKYITGGYTPVGIIPPSVIKENKESNDTFGSQLGKAGNFMLSKALPVTSMALGIPGIGSALPTGIGAAVNSFQAKRKENNDSTSSPLISLVRELADSAKMNYGGQLPNGAVKIKGAKDQKLNDSATLIKGNPNKTDGNQYLVNGQRIHLDNNEVVKGNMVVSDSVINPTTGNSFAKDVTDIEKQIGKASKDTSLEGRNTLKHLSNRTKSLIQQQEMITGRSNGTHFQKGGPIEPNWQTAGDLKFDSNKARIENGFIHVTDIKTGKERKVLRNNDGSYRRLTWADVLDDELRSDNYPVETIKKLANNPEVDFKVKHDDSSMTGRSHYTVSKNAIHLDSKAPDNKKTYIAELSHAIQKNTTKDLTTVNSINDWLRDPFITAKGQHRQYADPNGTEFRAHSQIEPIIYNSKGRQGLNPVKISGKNLKTSITDTDVSWTNEDGTLNTMVGKNIVKLKRNPDGTYNTLENRPMNSEEYIRFSNINANLRKSKDKQLNPKDEFDLQIASDRLNEQKDYVNMKFDKGGPLPKGLNVKDFQEWAIKNGATIKADGAWGPQTEALYTQYKDAYGLKDHTYDYNELADLTDRMGNVKQMENKNTPNRVLTESEKEQYQKMDGSVPTYNVDAAQLAKDNAERANAQTWSQPLPTSQTSIANQSTLPDLSKYRVQPAFEKDELAVTMSKLGALPDLFNVDGASETPSGIVTNPIVTPEEKKKQEAAARFKALGAKSGDALQAASVVSQMFRAHQKPKLEKRYNVNAPITKESFDVTNPLQQSNRTFKNMVSGIDAGSVNTKRAVANSMYANRLSNDSNTIQQYDVMNQGARSNYEQRLAQRQAQNIQLSQYTDDLDQRNLGAYNNAKDVAWSSVNNFGKGINDKKSAYANLEMLKRIYSDVAKNIK